MIMNATEVALQEVRAELAAMRAEIQEARDRQAILDCLATYCRGVDRHDEELILAAFHPDAVDEHGKSVHGMPEFAAVVNAGHAASTRMHTHNLTTHSCVIEGDEARAETYVLAGLASADETQVRLCGARYLDRLARRDGEWRILHRKVLIEWMLTGDASFFHSAVNQERGYAVGRRDREDPAYALFAKEGRHG